MKVHVLWKAEDHLRMASFSLQERESAEREGAQSRRRSENTQASVQFSRSKRCAPVGRPAVT